MFAKKAPVSIKQLAKMANLSTATISRVLNNNGRFSSKTRDMVIALVKETGYAPNVAAKALRTRTARAIGLVVPDIANEFFALIANAVERHFFDQAYSLFICNAGENARRNESILASLRGKGIDGLIYISRFPLNPAEVEAPVVYLDRIPNDDSALAGVSSDNRQGGRLAARALVEAGSRRPVMLCHADDLKRLATVNDRMTGFAEYLAERGVAWTAKDVILSPLTMSAARQNVRRAIEEGRRFDGLFVSSDIGAIGAVYGIEDAGLRVPQDVNVVGYDDISFCEYCRPALSTVRQNASALGREGARLLQAMMEKRPIQNKNIKVPVELVLRASTRRSSAESQS